ncbi:hypothetical protein IMG5_119040 [Ichthyophthirius multifiliis]|uniref:Transmembrane protein n=1 Tax=Ichthyophthirius multifiliis TaxID=5932 RepID=G0QUR8_ICHMU|nr:hypothetical protein IMG5_119040 [Ichthyophthirius multifiliis]EGR31031.1 hypothetical protein IMG5_119040 [Ichthyophthirius multifiliis]|eukprot:XP_004034517.1 hypothetical protein IMG5_119040 [Ichthyophthirius multifiliis]
MFYLLNLLINEIFFFGQIQRKDFILFILFDYLQIFCINLFQKAQYFLFIWIFFLSNVYFPLKFIFLLKIFLLKIYLFVYLFLYFDYSLFRYTFFIHFDFYQFLFHLFFQFPILLFQIQTVIEYFLVSYFRLNSNIIIFTLWTVFVIDSFVFALYLFSLQ